MKVEDEGVHFKKLPRAFPVASNGLAVRGDPQDDEESMTTSGRP